MKGCILKKSDLEGLKKVCKNFWPQRCFFDVRNSAIIGKAKVRYRPFLGMPFQKDDLIKVLEKRYQAKTIS